jgi:hypothetical protein
LPYRAGSELSERIDRLQRECRRLGSRLTETYWALLEAEGPIHRDPREAIDALSDEGSDDAEAIERALLRHRERLESAIANADDVRRRLVELPKDLPEPVARPPWPDSEGITLATADYVGMPADSRTRLAHDIAHCLGTLDAGVSLERRDDAIFAAPIHLFGAPMALLAEMVPLTGEVDLTITAPIRRALAPVRLERFTWVHTLTTAVRLHSDARVGDSEFDDRFLVTGSEPAARQLLDAELRAELMALAHFATPTLELASGLATLHFRYTFSSMLVERAARVLVRVRSRNVDVRLLKRG